MSVISGLYFRKFKISFIIVTVWLSAFQLSCEKKIKDMIWIERIDPELNTIIDDSVDIKVIAEGFVWSEGPLWLSDKQTLLFSDIPQNSIYQWSEDKGKQLYLKPSGYTDTVTRGGETGSNALLLNNKGQLVLCQHGDRRMALMDAPLDDPQPKFKPLASNYMGKRFNSPNDAVFRSNGDLFFTDPPYGLEGGMKNPKKEIPFQGVYRLDTMGHVHLLIDSISRPNGIAFLPGEKTLLVANSDSLRPVWYAFDISSTDSLLNGRIFYDASSAISTGIGLPDGMKVDHQGHVFACGPGGVFIFTSSGKLLGKIRTKTPSANCALAEEDKVLYITSKNYVFKVRLRK
ncbi:MAG: SMP-30/gluconolactonase/LRE family protein [Ginsengibacter sp.]